MMLLLQREYDGFAQRAKISKDGIPQFLKQQSISENSLRQFIVSNVIWEQYIRTVLPFGFFPSEKRDFHALSAGIESIIANKLSAL